MEQFIQIKIENSDAFKKEIIDGVVKEISNMNLFKKEPKKVDENEMVTRFEASQKLKISLVKLWELTKTGQLKKYKVGSKVLYKLIDINDFINSN